MHDSAMVGVSTHERRDHDFYATPAWCTEALLRMHNFDGGEIWEPACGDGAISKVLWDNGKIVFSTDLIFREYGKPKVNFLAQGKMPDPTKHIITNPPFGKEAEKFLRHALWLTEGTSGNVAFLLRNEFDCGKGRRDLFGSNRFHHKIVLTKRPMWIEGTKGSPRHNYSWFIFGPPLEASMDTNRTSYYHPDDWK